MAFQYQLGTLGRQSVRSNISEYLDVPTPRHSLLSGRFKQSFAYLTLRTRMPGIMQQIIQHLVNNRVYLEEEYGREVLKDINSIVDALERLKMELNRDRQFQLFRGNEPDKAEWNAFISELPKLKRTYFRACWLHAECYIYRRIYSFFENSKLLNGYDYFADLKREDLEISERAMNALTLATRGLPKNYEAFSKLMRINLWSNHYEIQLNAFVFSQDENRSKNHHENETTIDVLAQVADLDRNLLIDDSILIWNCLIKSKALCKDDVIVDLICDNGGFEFFTDMLLMEYLIDNGLATKVRLHVKAIPWYISDLTRNDVEWTINFLINHPSEMLSNLGRKWHKLMKDRKILVAPESYFWTGPQSYFVMVDSNLELYKLLSTAKLCIFKGDLNYRKLLGDYIWDSTEEFITCLRGFRPANICAMRTVKCEVVCGLPEGKADQLLKTDPQWMISSAYGLIQYTDALKCGCGLIGGTSTECSIHSIGRNSHCVMRLHKNKGT
ncbi:damage-control phosphatase ARMT1 [Drosophila willistoni]|nr:damage-control phosphatase ARMT1 [Drosophila willistoni]